ncbi:Ribosomal protein S16, mitochondrial, partial [Colletotrichum musicola]
TGSAWAPSRPKPSGGSCQWYETFALYHHQRIRGSQAMERLEKRERIDLSIRNDAGQRKVDTERRDSDANTIQVGILEPKYRPNGTLNTATAAKSLKQPASS